MVLFLCNTIKACFTSNFLILLKFFIPFLSIFLLAFFFVYYRCFPSCLPVTLLLQLTTSEIPLGLFYCYVKGTSIEYSHLELIPVIHCSFFIDSLLRQTTFWHGHSAYQSSIQRAKKVVSNSPGLVDFAIGLVNSVFNLPDGQVIFF